MQILRATENCGKRQGVKKRLKEKKEEAEWRKKHWRRGKRLVKRRSKWVAESKTK